MVIFQLIPLILTTVIYSRICIKLYWLPVVEGQGSEISRKRRQQAIRVVKMLIALQITYFVLSLPVSIVFNYETLRTGQRDVCNLKAYKPLLILCQFSNIVNPFILTYFNKTVKHRALGTFASLRRANFVTSEKSNPIQSSNV